MIQKKYDKFFLWISGALVLAGLFILSSASFGLLNKKGVTMSSVMLRQILIGIGFGGGLFLIASKIDYRKTQKFALPLFVFSFILTLLVFEPHIGFEHGGARRWLMLGPFFFQPAELLKLGFVFYLSSWIASRKKEIETIEGGLIPFLIFLGLVGLLLIFQPDLGTFGVIALTSAAMYFVGGGRLKHMAIMALVGVITVTALVFIKPHAMARFSVFFDPSGDPQGIGYQMKQVLIAVGSGGIMGRGLGMSIQKFHYLPEPVGDSIFAVFAEEFGFIGSVFLVGLFILFLYRGFHIAKKAPDPFGKLLATGITSSIIIQSLVNISTMVGLIPLTGLPLIFVSQGGSALAIAMAEVGILLNISKQGR